MHYLIIGGGIAGTTAAEELRKLNPKAEITIVSEEHHPLYSRVLLPHYIKGKVFRERVFLKKESWYENERIEYLCGIEAVGLDTKNKFVNLSDGREAPYDKLLIATGKAVRLMGDELRGVSYLRTLDDADHLVQLLRENPKSACVYGGGLIACEFLNIFAYFNIQTFLVHRAPHLFSKFITQETGDLVACHLRARGVEVFSSSDISSVNGGKQLESVTIHNNKLGCSILGIGIGVKPDLNWLRDSGVEIGEGVIANEFLETNIKDVFVAGDVAEFFHPVFDRRLLVGNWMNAASQGRAAASTMSGRRTGFDRVFSCATNLLGLETIFVGDTETSAAEKIITVGSLESGGITQILERGGRVVGGAMVGRNADRQVVERAIRDRKKWGE
jgi:NAD(P)H-nitrite reductase large subunit